MSVRTEGAETGADIPPDAECFYCSLPVRAIGVFWMGSQGSIWLHPGCVLELSVRLFRDVHEIEKGTATYLARREA